MASTLLALLAACGEWSASSRWPEPFTAGDRYAFRSTAFTTPPRADRGRLYALLVAVSRYHGAARDLPGGTAAVERVAARMLDALPDQSRAVLLTDEDATRTRLLAAVRALAIRVRPADTVMLVFDVHGDDQELLLEDRALARPQLARMLDALPCRVLLVVNACNAGAFSSVVAGRDDRAGIFSSGADEATYGSPMLRALGNAFARRVGRTPSGGLVLGAVTEYVERAARMDHPTSLHWTPLGVVSQHPSATLAPALARVELGGALTPAEAAGHDCRDIDACVRVDEALDHALDSLDDTGGGASGPGARE